MLLMLVLLLLGLGFVLEAFQHRRLATGATTETLYAADNVVVGGDVGVGVGGGGAAAAGVGV
jgi:hypothetical protein